MKISISRDGTEIGEWSEEEVRSFHAEGRLIDTDLYWKEGMTEWAALSRLIRPPPAFPKTALAPKERHSPAEPVVEPISDPETKYPGIERIPFLFAYFGLVGFAFFTEAQYTGPHDIGPTALGLTLVLGVLTYYRLINIGYRSVIFRLLLSLVPFVGLVILFDCLFRAPGAGPLAEQREQEQNRNRRRS